MMGKNSYHHIIIFNKKKFLSVGKVFARLPDNFASVNNVSPILNIINYGSKET